MPAFMYDVDEFDRTVDIVFAADDKEAALQVGCDPEAMRHKPEFDQYERQGEVRPVQWQEHGYRVPCFFCEHMVDDDICYSCDGDYPHDDDPEKNALTDDNRGVVDDGHHVFCDEVCMARSKTEWEQRRRERAAKGAS